MPTPSIVVTYTGPFKVKLTYFKTSGKFYSEGEYVTNKLQMYEIWEEILEMFASNKRPGLVDGSNHFYTLVEVPDHPHNHPHLILPTEKE